MISTNSKYKIILRWFSVIPAVFTVFVLSDWVVRLLFWFMRLPIIIFGKVTGSAGPIGKFMDSITNYLIGVGSIEALTIIVTGLVTGYAVIYVISIVVPSDKKKTTKILTWICLSLIGIICLLVARYLFFVGWDSFFGLIQDRFVGENTLIGIFLVIGIVFSLHSIKTQTEQESNSYENFVSNNTLAIFVSTLLFTILLMTFFQY